MILRVYNNYVFLIMLELDSYYIHQFKLIICGTITESLMQTAARMGDGVLSRP